MRAFLENDSSGDQKAPLDPEIVHTLKESQIALTSARNAITDPWPAGDNRRSGLHFLTFSDSPPRLARNGRTLLRTLVKRIVRGLKPPRGALPAGLEFAPARGAVRADPRVAWDVHVGNRWE